MHTSITCHFSTPKLQLLNKYQSEHIGT